MPAQKRLNSPGVSEVAPRCAVGSFNEGAVPMEPIMQVKVEVPIEFIGLVQGDLLLRRGQLLGVEYLVNDTVVHAEVPLAELQGYEAGLRSLCCGHGRFSMSFSHDQPLPEYLRSGNR